MGFWLNEVGAVAVLALAVFVWRVRPDRRQNRLFALMIAPWAVEREWIEGGAV